MNRLFLFLSVLLCFTPGNAQVQNRCSLEHNLFLSSSYKGKIQWVCGVLLVTEDSTNCTVSARFDVLRNWVPVDSLEIDLELDTTRLYKKMFRNDEQEMLRYFSSSGLELFLAVPRFHEYELSNGIKTSSCQYGHALVVFPKSWRKHQKKFDLFFEK
jgi:hypothetical protein